MDNVNILIYDFESTLQANRHLQRQEIYIFKEKILAYKNDPIIEVKGHMNKFCGLKEKIFTLTRKDIVMRKKKPIIFLA